MMLFTQHRKHHHQHRFIHQHPKLTLLFVSMAAFSFLTFLCFFLSSTASTNALIHHPFPNPKRSAHPIASWIQPGIRQACKATRYPDTCESSLLRLLPNCLPLSPNPLSFVHSSICLSAESEYRAMSVASCEVVWLRNLLGDMFVTIDQPVPLFCDNRVAIHIVKNPVFHERTKHIELDCHIVRQHYSTHLVLPEPISTLVQPADLFTKGLSSDRIIMLSSKLGVSNFLHSSA